MNHPLALLDVICRGVSRWVAKTNISKDPLEGSNPNTIEKSHDCNLGKSHPTLE